jgi:hypothetical protein
VYLRLDYRVNQLWSGVGEAANAVWLDKGEGLEVRDLTARMPNERTMDDDPRRQSDPGRSLLVPYLAGRRPPRLRRLADLWPSAGGVVRRAIDDGLAEPVTVVTPTRSSARPKRQPHRSPTLGESAVYRPGDGGRE